MRNLTLILATVILAGGAGAEVVTNRFTATLAQPLSAKKDFMANGNLFRCGGSNCVLISNPVDVGSVRSCQALEHQVGALTAYIVDGKPFDADKLGRCNSAN